MPVATGAFAALDATLLHKPHAALLHPSAGGTPRIVSGSVLTVAAEDSVLTNTGVVVVAAEAVAADAVAADAAVDADAAVEYGDVPTKAELSAPKAAS